MTANIKSLVFHVIITPFPFYKNMLIFQADLVLIKMGLYWPNFSLVFLIHSFLNAGVYCKLSTLEINAVPMAFHNNFIRTNNSGLENSAVGQ